MSLFVGVRNRRVNGCEVKKEKGTEVKKWRSKGKKEEEKEEGRGGGGGKGGRERIILRRDHVLLS